MGGCCSGGKKKGKSNKVDRSVSAKSAPAAPAAAPSPVPAPSPSSGPRSDTAPPKRRKPTAAFYYGAAGRERADSGSSREEDASTGEPGSASQRSARDTATAEEPKPEPGIPVAFHFAKASSASSEGPKGSSEAVGKEPKSESARDAPTAAPSPLDEEPGSKVLEADPDN